MFEAGAGGYADWVAEVTHGRTRERSGPSRLTVVFLGKAASEWQVTGGGASKTGERAAREGHPIHRT